jgi:hypothetical protein
VSERCNLLVRRWPRAGRNRRSRNGLLRFHPCSTLSVAGTRRHGANCGCGRQTRAEHPIGTNERPKIVTPPCDKPLECRTHPA